MNKTNQELYYERTPVLETERLILRPLTPEDAEAAFLWHSDPRVNKFMSYPLYIDVCQTVHWINDIVPIEEDFHWGIVLKENNILIGSISIGPMGNDDGAWGFGYNIRYEYWNKGYTTEATKRIIEFSHDVHGIKNFTASHAVDNPASGRVMEKCGLKFESYGEHSKRDGSMTYKIKKYRMQID